MGLVAGDGFGETSAPNFEGFGLRRAGLGLNPGMIRDRGAVFVRVNIVGSVDGFNLAGLS